MSLISSYHTIVFSTPTSSALTHDVVHSLAALSILSLKPRFVPVVYYLSMCTTDAFLGSSLLCTILFLSTRGKVTQCRLASEDMKQVFRNQSF